MKIIVFGASGDLAKRKLFPALAKLKLDDAEIIAFARTKYDKSFSEVLSDFYAYDDKTFCERIKYIKGKTYSDLEPLKTYLTKDTVCYLSLPPEVYIDVLKALENYDYGAVAVEKPFGEDSVSFANFKKFPTDKLYFVDHFLLKHLVVAWPIILDGCDELKRLMSNRHVKSVSVVFKEDIGGEGRAYFDTHGLVKDVVQSHLSELFALAALKKHIIACKDRSFERCKIFAKTKILPEHCLFGQYQEYEHEMGKKSDTETFSIISFSLDVPEWHNVPFITVCGKGLNEKRTEIVYEFNNNSYVDILSMINKDRDYNLEEICCIRLVLNLYPKNEIYVEVTQGHNSHFHTLFDRKEVERHMHERYGRYENHEIIFNSLSKQTEFDCVRYNEAEELWRMFTEVLEKPKTLFYYSKGTDMPVPAEKKLEAIKNQ